MVAGDVNDLILYYFLQGERPIADAIRIGLSLIVLRFSRDNELRNVCGGGGGEVGFGDVGDKGSCKCVAFIVGVLAAFSGSDFAGGSREFA